MKTITTLLTLLFLQSATANGWFRDNSLYDEAYAALESTAAVTVDSNRKFFRFTPNTAVRGACLIIYPGAFINPRAYAPIAHKMADAGFLSYVVRFPLRFGLLKPNAASDAKNDPIAEENCQAFVLSGHSLGGVVAARHANNEGDAALVLLASYTEDDVFLDSSIKATSIWATEDAITTPNDIENSKARLPADTNYVRIDGGIHAHFSWSKPRRDDGEPLITVAQQQAIINAEMLKVLEQIDAAN